jgi:GTP-binding protein HflX
LHNIDAAEPRREERIAQVDEVLADIGAGDIPQVLVYNKIDKLRARRTDDEVDDTAPDGSDAATDDDFPTGIAPRHDRPHDAQPDEAVRERVWLSARDGLGLDLLRDALVARLGLARLVADLRLPPSAGRLRARLHALGAIRAESHEADGWVLRVDLPRADAAKLAAQDDGAPLREFLLEVDLADLSGGESGHTL